MAWRQCLQLFGSDRAKSEENHVSLICVKQQLGLSNIADLLAKEAGAGADVAGACLIAR